MNWGANVALLIRVRQAGGKNFSKVRNLPVSLHPFLSRYKYHYA